jgi:hypothetical protein
MIELALIVCTIYGPTECKPVSLVFAAEPGMALQCQMGLAGQDQIAKWSAAHPQYTVKRWTCRPAGMVAKA